MQPSSVGIGVLDLLEYELSTVMVSLNRSMARIKIFFFLLFVSHHPVKSVFHLFVAEHKVYI